MNQTNAESRMWITVVLLLRYRAHVSSVTSVVQFNIVADVTGFALGSKRLLGRRI